MAQPQYDDTDFTSLNNEVFDITITVFDAGVFTVELDGGPYTGSGATITLIRDALLTSIQGGTHVNYTAASQGTDAIRITATGPAQFIGGTPTFTEPAFIAPGSGAITKTVVTPREGIAFGVLYESIRVHPLIFTPLEPLRTAISWVSLDGAPRVLQINFTVDPLPAGEKTSLDGVVAGFTNLEFANPIAQFFRTAEQDVGFVHLGADFVLATAGAPNFGVKLANISTALASAKDYIQGFQVQQGTTDVKITVWSGCATSLSGDVTIVSAVNMVFDGSTTGVNGMDVGTLSNDLIHAIYVIRKDDGTTDLLGSLKFDWITGDSPTMPSGYTERRYVGAFRTHSSGDIYQQHTYGDGNSVRVVYGTDRTIAPFLILPAGNQQSFTTIDMNGIVPPTATDIAVHINDKATNDIYLRPMLDETTPLNATFGTHATDKGDRSNFDISLFRSLTTMIRELQYKVVGASGNLDISGMGYEERR